MSRGLRLLFLQFSGNGFEFAIRFFQLVGFALELSLDFLAEIAAESLPARCAWEIPCFSLAIFFLIPSKSFSTLAA